MCRYYVLVQKILKDKTGSNVVGLKVNKAVYVISAYKLGLITGIDETTWDNLMSVLEDAINTQDNDSDIEELFENALMSRTSDSIEYAKFNVEMEKHYERMYREMFK